MAKAVLISIRPEWVWKILSGEKTLEVRRTRPKLETPFKCYIYCTYNGGHLANLKEFLNGKVVAEFVCDKITQLTHIGCSGVPGVWLAAMKNGYTIDDLFDFSGSCLPPAQIEKYLDGGPGCAWHISTLKIYDVPKQLSEFTGLRRTKFGYASNEVKRPPQSWCYVEELEGEQ